MRSIPKKTRFIKD